MAVPGGPPESGQLSPDARGVAWIWWLSGCAALVAVLVIGGFAVGGFALYNAARSGAFNCVPSDFPKYPNLAFRSLNAKTNGAQSSCEIVYASSDSAPAVVDFYTSKLGEAPWQVRDSGPSAIDFVNSDTGATGTVQVTPTSSGSEILIDYQGP